MIILLVIIALIIVIVYSANRDNYEAQHHVKSYNRSPKLYDDDIEKWNIGYQDIQKYLGTYAQMYGAMYLYPPEKRPFFAQDKDAAHAYFKCLVKATAFHFGWVPYELKDKELDPFKPYYNEFGEKEKEFFSDYTSPYQVSKENAGCICWWYMPDESRNSYKKMNIVNMPYGKQIDIRDVLSKDYRRTFRGDEKLVISDEEYETKLNNHEIAPIMDYPVIDGNSNDFAKDKLVIGFAQIKNEFKEIRLSDLNLKNMVEKAYHEQGLSPRYNYYKRAELGYGGVVENRFMAIKYFYPRDVIGKTSQKLQKIKAYIKDYPYLLDKDIIDQYT